MLANLVCHNFRGHWLNFELVVCAGVGSVFSNRGGCGGTDGPPHDAINIPTSAKMTRMNFISDPSCDPLIEFGLVGSSALVDLPLSTLFRKL